MALWTPYTEKALDLSRTTVKREVSSPLPVQFLARIPASDPLPHPYFIEQYEQSYVPLSQISPESVGSTWSPKSCGKALSPLQSPDAYDVESLSDDVEYQAFERDALRAMVEKSGGALIGNNPRMRRAVQTSQAADDSYRKQRERNNFAAKQSRDRRKLREVRLAFQVTFLKKKLADLRARLGERLCHRCQQQCHC